MSQPTTTTPTSTLPFDRFWHWLKQHTHCILRAGTGESWLYDHEAFHWHLEEDGERNPVVQLVWGKLLVGEMVMDLRDVLFVQVTPDPENPEPGHVLFELVSSGEEEPFGVYHFLLAHGYDEVTRHGVVEH
jgi:hypothetical protein